MHSVTCVIMTALTIHKPDSHFSAFQFRSIRHSLDITTFILFFFRGVFVLPMRRLVTLGKPVTVAKKGSGKKHARVFCVFSLTP